MEQLTCQSARQGSQLHRIQKTTENIHVSDGLRRIVTFLIIAPYKYSYLLTYSSISLIIYYFFIFCVCILFRFRNSQIFCLHRACI